ncbi:SNF2 domain-containing protein CLASSY 3-like isoform X2 [Salvia divinorum]|uniref:SNF2 domain-containing protein CLASSY 3-like isoform X2 n=1 Tax=Salvia divinorum TaxID=28513 RepID=A0ABD1HZZ5_SALDI
MADDSSRSSDLESEEIYGRIERNRHVAPQLRKKTCEEAKEAFFQSISGRTRSNRDACIGVYPSSSGSIRKRQKNRQEMPTPSVGGQRKIPGSSWQKPFASVVISHEDVSHRRVRVEEEIAVIDKAEFISRKSFSTSKIRSSSKGSMTRGSSSHKPISIILLESDSDDNMMAEDIEIQIFDEAELRNQNTHFKSKIGKSEKEGGSAARLSKNVGEASARKAIVSAHHSMAFTPRDYFTSSDSLANDSTTLADKANNNEGRNFREITSKRSIEGMLKKSKSPYSQADRTGSSAQKVNRYEDRDYEQPGIETISESEFKKRKRLSENGSSTSKEQDEGHIATTSAKNVKRVSEKMPSFLKNDGNKRKYSDSSLKRRGEAWNHVVDDVDKSLDEFLCSSSSSEFGSDGVKNKRDSDSSLRRRGEAWNHHVDVDDVDTDEFLCSSSSSESDSDDASTSMQDSEDSSYDPEQEMSVSIANQTKQKTGRSKKASSPPTDSDSGSSLDADAEVGSSDSNIEWHPPHDACKVVEENEKLDGLFHYKTDAEEGLNETCSKQPNNEKSQSQAWATGPKEVTPTTDSKYGSDHSGGGGGGGDDDDIDDKEEERTSSVFLVCGKATTESLAVETKVSSRPKQADLPSHSRDGYDHSRGAKEITEDSHVRAKKKTPNMARETKVPSEPKEAALPSHLRDGYDHSHDDAKERTENSHVRAKKKTPNMARETKVPSEPKEAALPSHLRDGYDHSHDDAKERTENSHVRAKKKIPDMAKEKEANPSSQSKDNHDHSHDGTKKRTEAGLASDSHMRAGIASEKKVRGRRKKAATPSHSEDVCDHAHEGTKERVETGSLDNSWTEAVHKELCSMLANAVLGSGQLPADREIYEEAKQELAPPTPYTLPLKFRFEDEVPKPVEKTEYEKEIDDLFSDLDCDWALDKVQSFDYPKDSLENGNPPREETQHERCSRGEHDLVLEDDEGLVCKFCRYQALGPKDIMPEWLERPYRESDRKRSHEKEHLFEFDDLHLSTNDADAAGSSSNATGTIWNIKPGVRDSMYEHQREGIEFLWKNLAGSIDLDKLKSTKPAGVGGCIISHAPGTGKTRLTMVFIETYLKLFPGCRPVIISPASTLLNWEEEFEKWNVEFPFHNLNNTEFSGKENKGLVERIPQNKRNNNEAIRMIKILSWSMVGGILGISYSLFGKLTGNAAEDRLLRRILLEVPGLVVLDEGHTPRNSRSNIWNALLKLKTEKRIILSGTPFQNNFSELFNTLRIVRPAVADVLAEEKMFAEAVVPKRTSWSSRNKNKREHAQSSLISERALQHLKGCMSPFVNLHTGTILKQSLPGLRDCVILLKPSALQKSVIETIEDSCNFKYEHEVGMISVHPYLLLECETTESRKTGIDMAAVEASKLNPQAGVKTKFLMELIRLCMAVNEKVLVFSQYLNPLMLIKEQLKEVLKWAEEKEILIMHGKQKQNRRQILINLFNNPDHESRIMLASTKCCAEGISLVGASRVVLLDVVWNPSVERQAICRAYRIGQKKFVYTYHLMTSGTSEDDKYLRQVEKERLSELVFSSSKTNQQKQTSFGIEDRILEAMVAHEHLKEMFEKIINQPKETNLIETFGLTD